MKILTKKEQDKIISLLCENAVIFHRNIIEDSDVESVYSSISNTESKERSDLQCQTL